MSRSGKPTAFVAVPEFVAKPHCIGSFPALAQDLALFRQGFPALVLEERPVRFASRRDG